MHQCKLLQIPCCLTMGSHIDAHMFPNVYFANELNIPRAELARRFSSFESQKGNFELICNPFAVDV